MVNSGKSLRDTQENKKPPKFKFKEGERILCFHGPLIYEAKCLQNRIEDKDVQYLVHYAGWNKSWDEWVPEYRVLKYNENNLLKLKALHKAHKLEPKGKCKKRASDKDDGIKDGEAGDSRCSTPVKFGGRWSVSGSSSPESSSDSPKKKSSKVDPTVETEAQFLSRLEIKIKLPDELKPLLVDDWENILASRLLKLPAKIPVDKVLDDYLKYTASLKNYNNTSAHKESVRQEMVRGIKDYFNPMLGSQLLYDIERKQFNEIMKEQPSNTLPSAVYGPIFLLRFFVKFGQTLSYTKLDEKGVQFLLSHINEFLRFMLKNVNTYFNVEDYSQARIEAPKH